MAKRRARRTKKTNYSGLKKLLLPFLLFVLLFSVSWVILGNQGKGVLSAQSSLFGNVGNFSTASNTYIKTNDSAFNYYAEDMAIQGLIKFNPVAGNTSDYTIVSRDDVLNTGKGFTLKIDSSNHLDFIYSVRGSSYNFSTGFLYGPYVSPGVWHTFFLTYNYDIATGNGDVKIYLDGNPGGVVHEGVASIAGGGFGSTIVGNNASLNAPFSGSIDELRLSNSSSVTGVITAPLSKDNNTDMLMHFDESSGNPSAVGKFTITTNAQGLTYSPSDYGLATTATNTPTPTPTPTIAMNYALSGKVFVDSNKNGKKDSSEKFYTAGTTVSATNVLTWSTRTLTDGSYKLNLKRGSYKVSLKIPAGYRATTQSTATLNISKNTNLNFGIVKK